MPFSKNKFKSDAEFDTLTLYSSEGSALNLLGKGGGTVYPLLSLMLKIESSSIYSSDKNTKDCTQGITILLIKVHIYLLLTQDDVLW